MVSWGPVRGRMHKMKTPDRDVLQAACERHEEAFTDVNLGQLPVGIGSAEGELIQIKSESGEFVFLKDRNGNFVKSRLNESLLKQVALITGGIYVKASGSKFGLDLIYERELSKLEKREIESKMEKKYFDRFQFPLGFAALLLVIETCITRRKKQQKSS